MRPADEQPGPDAPVPSAGTRRRVDLLYRAAAPGLARRLRAKVGSQDEAREIVHDAFARLLGAAGFERIGKPEAFLNRIVRNLLIDRALSSRNRAQHIPIGDAPELAVPADQHREIELEQMRERYRDAVAGLPPRMREVFTLHRVEELSYKEIAERLDIGVRTVAWHIAEALVRIDRELTR